MKKLTAPLTFGPGNTWKLVLCCHPEHSRRISCLPERLLSAEILHFVQHDKYDTFLSVLVPRPILNLIGDREPHWYREGLSL